MAKEYQPPKEILEKYADVLVNFALGWGKGIKKGDTVLLTVSEYAKPLYKELRLAILKAGGHVIGDYRPDESEDYNFGKDFYENAADHQINYFPKHYIKGLIDQIDHSLYIVSETHPKGLAEVDPGKVMKRQVAFKQYGEWRQEKENRGKFTWTIALYGTPAEAKEAGLSLKEYWNQIIKACFLDEANPVEKWREVFNQIDNYESKLNKLNIEKVHVEGPDADLWLTIGKNRKWIGGRGANIPSFEIFTSPDWRGTNGRIRFNQPLYRFGNLVEGIELEFKNGKVVKYKAKKNEQVLKSMLEAKGGDKVGEFSLTDKRFSRITKFMAETLFDENVGGKFGNTHIALGRAYHECYKGKMDKVKKGDWAKMGYNDSSLHSDIVSTAGRTVTAYLPSGRSKVIYKDGQFVL